MAFDAARGEMVLFGGMHDGQNLGDTWIWNGVEWREVSTPGPSPRREHVMAYDVANDLILLYGGWPSEFSDQLWAWDGASWTQLDQGVVTPGGLQGSAMAYDPLRQRAVLFGGIGAQGHASTVAEWDGREWVVLTPEGPEAVAFHAMAFDPIGAGVLVHGGHRQNSSSTSESWLWNGSEWRRVASGDPGRKYRHAMAADTARNIIVLFGGAGDVGMSEWNGSEWTTVELGPTPRESHVMAFDAVNGRVLIHGGRAPATTGELLAWDGQSWTTLPPSSSRCEHAGVFDSRRGSLVVFGGRDPAESLRDETLEWDGAIWRESRPSGPRGRADHAAAFDSARDVMVLHAGRNNYNAFADTWAWNGLGWSLLADEGLPGRRHEHAMAYDSHRQVMVVFGGKDAGGALLGDTKEWDGVEWRTVWQSGPQPRSGHCLAFDVDRGVVILHGGEDNQGFLDDTWEWNGVSWNQIGSAGPARARHTIVYDPIRKSLILFGGRTDFLWGDVLVSRSALEFLAQPDHQFVLSGQPATFHVRATGGSQIAYQWRRSGQDLVDGGTISGSNTETLRISRASRFDEAVYDCVVTGDCGPMLSRSAQLFITAPVLTVQPSCPDGGRIVVSWENVSRGGQVAVIFAQSTGTLRIPDGNRCAGTVLGLSGQAIQVVFTGPGGEQGSRTIQGSAGPNACGGYLQLLDLPSCAVSNVARIE